jgi:DNA-binding NtrC family response regulator
VQRHDRITILVADYDRWARQSLVTTLTAAGFDVSEVSNGMAAVRSALAAPPHVVLVGRVLPEIDGAGVAQMLQAEAGTRHTAVLQTTPTLVERPVELVASIFEALHGRDAAIRRLAVAEVGTADLVLVRARDAAALVAA